MTQAMMVHNGDTALPNDIQQVRQLAKDAIGSGFCGFKRAEDAMLAILTGRDLGFSAAQSLRAFHVIEGKPTLSADAMVAACVSRKDVCEYFRTVESTGRICTVETKRAGEGGPRRLSFTIEEAQAANLTGKGNWGKYPAAMLRARAKSALARDVYPDLLMGLYDPDELANVERPVVVHMPTPEPVAQIVEPEPEAVPQQSARAVLDTIEALRMETLDAFATWIKGSIASYSDAEQKQIRSAYSTKSKALKAEAAAERQRHEEAAQQAQDAADALDAEGEVVRAGND
jgi:hypothetical protein